MPPYGHGASSRRDVERAAWWQHRSCGSWRSPWVPGQKGVLSGNRSKVTPSHMATQRLSTGLWCRPFLRLELSPKWKADPERDERAEGAGRGHF